MKSSLSFIPVYNSLWHLTHFVFNIIYLVYQKFIAPLLILKIIYLKIKNKGENDTVNCFKLNKLPQHLTVVIAENEIYVDTFVYLITWCQQLNISYLSIYINNDNHKTHCNLLRKAIKLKGDLNDNGETKFQISNGNALNEFSNDYVLDGGKVKVMILNRNEGKRSLVSAAKHFANLNNLDIKQDDVDNYLKKSYNFPDPEVLISFGVSPSLFGYPPWQIRLTEIFFFPNHKNFSKYQFLDVLLKYSKCEQRFGK